MRPIILLLPVVLASCTRPVAPGGANHSQALAGYAAGAPQTCVPTSSNDSLQLIDPGTVIYGSGRTVYVNHLGGPCSALSPPSTLIVDAQPGHYCRGDRVRGFEPGGLIPGPVCILGDWVPYRKQ
jgi:hypothetical protein